MEPHRHERVLIETDHHRLTGTVTLARDGYRSRVSDVLNATEKEFLALTDATVERLDGVSEPVHHPWVAVARRQIVLAVPERGEDGPPELRAV